MRLWRCVWFDDDLISVEIFEVPPKIHAIAREEGKGAADILQAGVRCIDTPTPTDSGQKGHACFVAGETIEKALAEARARHPTKMAQ
jgi:hypothetical protein